MRVRALISAALHAPVSLLSVPMIPGDPLAAKLQSN